MQLLGGLDARTFLRRHWQKRPLLVRRAFPSWRDPVSPRRLLELAARPEAESRLVRVRGGAAPWEVTHGPLPGRLAGRLPEKDWTVLVQEVNAHVPAAAALLERFDFVPRWRLDDVMVSYAVPGGTVGPHADSYDVFLIQGRGRRRWQVSAHFDPALRAGLDLRVLRRFQAEEEWVLEPGDMLYLPPGVAHHGVALDPCLTFSIGFRAPSQAELLLAVLKQATRGAARSAQYADPGLRPPAHPGEIEAAALARLRRLARRGWPDQAALDRVLGEVLTEPKAAPPPPLAAPLTTSRLRGRLRDHDLVRHGATRAAFTREGPCLLFFVNGRAEEWPRRDLPLARALAGPRRLPGRELLEVLEGPGLRRLAALVSEGAWLLEAAPPAPGSQRGVRSRS